MMVLALANTKLTIFPARFLLILFKFFLSDVRHVFFVVLLIIGKCMLKRAMRELDYADFAQEFHV